MLTVEENERVTRVGPNTPGGKYFRRFWWPMCLSTEWPERDGAPLRVRLLGEDLIAYRDTEGKVGLVDARKFTAVRQCHLCAGGKVGAHNSALRQALRTQHAMRVMVGSAGQSRDVNWVKLTDGVVLRRLRRLSG